MRRRNFYVFPRVALRNIDGVSDIRGERFICLQAVQRLQRPRLRSIGWCDCLRMCRSVAATLTSTLCASQHKQFAHVMTCYHVERALLEHSKLS
jgi:hypothetical protein